MRDGLRLLRRPQDEVVVLRDIERLVQAAQAAQERRLECEQVDDVRMLAQVLQRERRGGDSCRVL